MNRLQKYYENIVRFDLLFKDHYINVMELPQMSHITLNTGIGLKAILDKKQILTALLNMELVSGQRPIITRAKKSLDKFKLREKMPIGCKVTLRRSNLYVFLDRFINIVIPFADDSNDIFNHPYYSRYILKQKELYNLPISFSHETFSVISSSTPSLSGDSALFFQTLPVSRPRFDFYTRCSPNLRSKFWFSGGTKPYTNSLGGPDSTPPQYLFFKKKMFIPKGVHYLFCNLNIIEKSFLMNHTFIFSNYTSDLGKACSVAHHHYVHSVSLCSLTPKNNTKNITFCSSAVAPKMHQGFTFRPANSPIYSVAEGKTNPFSMLASLNSNLAFNTWLQPKDASLNIKKNTRFVFRPRFKHVSKFNYYTVAFGFKDFISSTAFGTVFNCGQLDVSYGFDIMFVIRYLKNKRVIQPSYFLSSFQMPF